MKTPPGRALARKITQYERSLPVTDQTSTPMPSIVLQEPTSYSVEPAISFDQCLELFREMKNAPTGPHVATEEYRSLLKALYQRMEMDVNMAVEGKEG